METEIQLEAAFWDLKGKRPFMPVEGATPEWQSLLEKNGISDVHIEWKTNIQVVQALAEDQGIALLPEPFVTVATTKNPKIRVAL